MQISDFLKKINNFGDGLIKEIKFHWNSSGNQECFEFLISLPENQLGMHEIFIVVDGVRKFKFLHDREKLNYQVLSNGIHVTKFGDLWSMEFGCFADPPRDIDELCESDFYVMGKEISFKNGDFSLLVVD